MVYKSFINGSQYDKKYVGNLKRLFFVIFILYLQKI